MTLSAPTIRCGGCVAAIERALVSRPDVDRARANLTLRRISVTPSPAAADLSGILDALDRIGLSLAAQIDAEPASVFDKGPVERVGAILNFSTAATRDDVLNGLDETDRLFADEVRKAIFTFVNIPDRIAPRDIPKVVRELDQLELVTALAAAAATPETNRSAEYILSNMSGRLADQLREEVQEAGKVKAKDGEAAMTSIVTTIRGMETAGELLLIAAEEEED